MDAAWEAEISHFIQHLLAVQDETLRLLSEKRALLARADADALAALGPREEEIVHRLQHCLAWREEMLRRAKADGMPGESVASLARGLPATHRRSLEGPLATASGQARLLQHQGLTNWVLAQRSLLHVAQMLEIIATGGRLQPTYSQGEPVCATGALVDKAA